MKNDALKHTFIPELGQPRSGKVRDIYETGDTLILVASDRFSAYNHVFEEPIPDKGRVLNGISKFWFDHTSDIVPNHLISMPDPNVMVVKKCTPLLVEVVVRGYMVGSIWRDYAKGKRLKSGVQLPEGLSENEKLAMPIITPTAKSEDDPQMTPQELIKDGVVTAELWKEIADVSIRLFKRGQELALKQGLILVDTKYEFGLDSQNKLMLIDEVHTPDSSRFWYADDYEKRQLNFPDKEFARKWIWDNGYGASGTIAPLPEEIRQKVRANYCELYQKITGQTIDQTAGSVPERLRRNLMKAGLIQGGFILVVSNLPVHIEKIPFIQLNKNEDAIRKYDASIEPILVVTTEPVEEIKRYTCWPIMPLNATDLQTTYKELIR